MHHDLKLSVPNLKWITVLIASVYLLQLVSPLRLNTDGIDLLHMAQSGADTGNFYPHSESVRYPPGYPWMLSLLISAGLLNSASIIGLNLLFLGIGLWAFASAQFGERQHDRSLVWLAVACTLLSWVLIKHVTLPLTDVPFMGAALVSLALMARTEYVAPRTAWLLALAAAVACAAAMSIRTVGVTLLPPLVWMVYSLLSRGWTLRGLLDKIFSVLLLTGLCAGWLLLIGGYASVSAPGHGYSTEALKTNWWLQAQDLGRVALNVPYVQPWMLYPIGLFGLVLMAVFAVRLCPLSGRRPGCAEVFVVSYIGLFLLWPHHDPRFFLPVIPYVLLLIVSFLPSGCHKLPSLALPLYSAWVAAMGGAALIYTSWLSLSGPRFAERFGGREGRAVYEKFYRGDWDSASEGEKNVMLLLKRFDAGRMGSSSNDARAENVSSVRGDEY
jgi:4-amino-4-deoxy-L-arabinose transferase-like glycosyltransferase